MPLIQSIRDARFQQVILTAQQQRQFQSPVEWRNTWIYFILVDRFNNPQRGPVSQWDQPVQNFQGGTLEGIRAQLNYLQNLGVSTLWLSPILKNCPYDNTYHGYGVQNFLAVDPRFARNQADPDTELRQLVDDAHRRGIYVILDIILHHAGDVFNYDGIGSIANWSNTVYPIHWRDAQGTPTWPTLPNPNPLTLNDVVWPQELQDNALFERQGDALSAGGLPAGDFRTLKSFSQRANPNVMNPYPVLETLIQTHEYLIGKFDIDGFRIDTLMYLTPSVTRLFANSIREFARTLHKDNFFTFGEIYSTEQEIAQFVGRNTTDPTNTDIIGVDAALDYPLFYVLPAVCKGSLPPSALVSIYQLRKKVEQDILSTHGDASNYFVTFLDNHDQPNRFYCHCGANLHQYDDQVTLALGCLFALPGIPCVYYGTEQGLFGSGNNESVREALWGKPNAFDQTAPFYVAIQQLSTLRSQQLALCSGRYYFRPISRDGLHFGISTYPQGVLAFSRILADQEVIIVANTSTVAGWGGYVIIDDTLHQNGDICTILYTNQGPPPASVNVSTTPNGSTIVEVDGSTSGGPARVLSVNLRPMEIQILR